MSRDLCDFFSPYKYSYLQLRVSFFSLPSMNINKQAKCKYIENKWNINGAFTLYDIYIYIIYGRCILVGIRRYIVDAAYEGRRRFLTQWKWCDRRREKSVAMRIVFIYVSSVTLHFLCIYIIFAFLRGTTYLNLNLFTRFELLSVWKKHQKK